MADGCVPLFQLHLPSVPSILTVTGMFDVEYRMLIACRNGKIYTAKRGMEEGRLTAELSSQPVGLERREKSFLVGCMDDNVYCFSNHVSREAGGSGEQDRWLLGKGELSCQESGRGSGRIRDVN
ncbi:Bardet-Biedl syndrome 1 protein [Amphibalanus amphitrite]|uniref:Bardet-Biedl syndrome 1 protein n=1 Tax=Amphibalanus amphitrite TaxID=1232801 RepID=A0A6A4VNE4_AMPAM|nr:Bardet-Biedl syndrome 1 protein [Amphibalanus amphitrite]